MPKVSKNSKKNIRNLRRRMIGGQSAFEVNPDKIIRIEDVDEIIRSNKLPPLSNKHLITLSAFKKLRLEKPDMNIFNNQQSFYGKHQKCIDKGDTIKYQNSDGQTLRNIPDQVPWEIDSPGYLPNSHTIKAVLNIPDGQTKHPWADPEDFNEPWENFQESNIMNCYPYKKSFEGLMIIDDVSGKPLNPMGRTGLIDRGELGRWGCNYAADPVVIRKNNGILEMACILRKQDGKWAIPGGMVDPGDDVSKTLKKEFGEEAMASSTDEEIDRMFNTLKTRDEGGIGIKIHKGYVDDSRNTDNAWMETTAFLFYVGDMLDETNPNMHFIANLNLTGNPTEGKVSWMNIEDDSFVDQMFASHPIMVRQARDMVKQIISPVPAPAAPAGPNCSGTTVTVNQLATFITGEDQDLGDIGEKYACVDISGAVSTPFKKQKTREGGKKSHRRSSVAHKKSTASHKSAVAKLFQASTKNRSKIPAKKSLKVVKVRSKR